MKSVKIIACLILIALATSGCQTRLKIPEYTSPETVCDKENDQYLDFIDTETCIRPGTYEQLYILDQYRRVQQLTKDNPEQQIEIQVSFKHYPTAEEFQALLDESIERVTFIDMFYPDFDNGSGMPVFIRDESVTKEQALSYAENENRTAAYQIDASAREFAASVRAQGHTINYTELNESMLQNYQIRAARFSIRTDQIADWWKKHLDLIRVVQSVVSDFDHAQEAFDPDDNIGPDEQIINWEEI